ncbi:hypothetical protein ACP6C7_18840 [Mycolicibacterium septicum]|uniref:Phage gp6-like head-tail connector protein n=1 Tax=Mycolicibacterium septicum TaxID=98668 RepID=A0ABW9LUM1_9MYCO
MTWAPAYCEADELAGWLGIDEDPELALAIEAASRAIDQACGRQFGVVDEPEPRFYEPQWHRNHWYLDVDDLMTDESLAIETVDISGAVVNTLSGVLTPRNAAPVGKPWRRIELAPGSPVRGDFVRVTAKWGWTNVPGAIILATKIQAGRWYARRENVGGPLTLHEVDDVRYGWAAGQNTDLDSDVLASIAPYRKLWVAV